MIVKFLSKAGSFAGVRYNTDKMDKQTGELIAAKNFGSLAALGTVRPSDYQNYLKMLTAQSKRIKLPQLHVAISAKGRSYDKAALGKLAEKWMDAMGYGNQPYLVVFHKDTDNNHVHIVSTRIGRDGKKIDAAYERRRGIREINKLIGLDETLQCKSDLEKALSYNFQTNAQFMMLMEQMGYGVKLKDEEIDVFKYGERQSTLPLSDLKTKIQTSNVDHDRVNQLKAIFHRYQSSCDSTLKAVVNEGPGGMRKTTSRYSTDFTELMREKFGVEILFHSAEGKRPYGYTIMDHSGKNVFKGAEVMALSTLLSANEIQTAVTTEVSGDPKASARELLDGNQGTNIQERHMDEEQVQEYVQQPNVQVQIADDVDDEQILGRNRRRQGKARTNTR